MTPIKLNTKTQKHKGQRTKLIFFVALCLGVSRNTVTAQNVVVADAVTRHSIAHASLYTKEDGRFNSCVTDGQGVAHVTFTFRRLTVSHLNYQQFILHTSTLPDTLFLQPRYRDVGQVVVTNREPEWIRRCLKRAIKQKDELYYGHEDYGLFTYHTQSLGTNSIYRMTLTGLLRHKSPGNKQYAMQPDTARIVAADSTRLTDTSNLRRMLYEDFVSDLDNGFVRHHRFYANYEYRGQTPDEIELRFRSQKNADDYGTLVIDTMRCTIVGAYRHTGTKTNRHERIDALMYRIAQVFGYRIDTFIRDYRVHYAYRTDGTLYPAEVSYKLIYGGRDGDYDKSKEEFNEQTGGGFPNMEATLTVRPLTLNSQPSTLHSQLLTLNWTDLPPSWYIKYNTEADRQKEIELSSLPATFRIYEEENNEE